MIGAWLTMAAAFAGAQDTEPEPGHARFHRAPRALAADARTEDWPTFLGPRRDATSSETRLSMEWPPEGPPLVWELERGEGYASPSIAAGRLLFTHRDTTAAHVEALDAETGARLWRYTYPCDYRGAYIKNSGPRSSPTLAGERAYVHGVEGVLRCFDVESGEVVWERDLATEFDVRDDFFGVVSSPLVFGDTLIQNVGAAGGPGVMAFDLATGETIWQTEAQWGAGCPSPVVAEVHGRERLFVLCGGESRPPTGGLLVLDPADGALDFAYPFRSRTYESVNGASPVIAGERVFLTASYNTGTAALKLTEDGSFEELWKTKRIGMQFSNPVFVDGYLYAVDGRSDRAGAVVCIDPATGEEAARSDLYWDEQVFYGGEEKTISFSIGEGSLLAVEDGFLCLGDNGHLLSLRASPAGTEVRSRASLFRANESWTPLVLSHGLLYVCQNNRERFGTEPEPARLLCYDLRAGEAE